MRCKSISGSYGKRAKERSELRKRYRSRVLRFETLDARWMCAADSGSPAATYPMADDGPALPAMVAEQTEVTETPSALMDASADRAWQLLDEASELLSIEEATALRMRDELEAFWEHEDGAHGLPQQGDEDADPMTAAIQLPGDRHSHPPMPGTPEGGDRSETLHGMMEGFRRRGEGGGQDDSQRDPFARVGWAGQDGDRVTSGLSTASWQVLAWGTGV